MGRLASDSMLWIGFAGLVFGARSVVLGDKGGCALLSDEKYN